MLVFQSHWEHIEERFRERSGGSFRWLLEAVAEINLYLPDDWRMTRSTNNFRIQIAGGHHPALVGRSYRGPGDMVLHIIDSVFRKEFHDNIDLRAKRRSSRDMESGEDSSLFVPNLYFFSPSPDNSISPLFARQYEKVKKGPDGKLLPLQYHRIHPLTKAGLDLEHFRWVLWKNDGTVELDKMPDPAFHGKNYWKTPALTGTEGSRRRKDHTYYLDLYRSVLKCAGVTPPRPAEKSPGFYEREYKLMVQGTEDDARAAFSLIEDEASRGAPIAGFLPVPDTQRQGLQEDIYFNVNLSRITPIEF